MFELIFRADKEIFRHSLWLPLLLSAANRTAPYKPAATPPSIANFGSGFADEEICVLRPPILKFRTRAASAIATNRNNQLAVSFGKRRAIAGSEFNRHPSCETFRNLVNTCGPFFLTSDNEANECQYEESWSHVA